MIQHTVVSFLTSSIQHSSVKNGDSETYIKHLLLHNFGVHTTTVQVTHKTKKGGSVIYSFCSNKFPKTFTVIFLVSLHTSTYFHSKANKYDRNLAPDTELFKQPI